MWFLVLRSWFLVRPRSLVLSPGRRQPLRIQSARRGPSTLDYGRTKNQEPRTKDCGYRKSKAVLAACAGLVWLAAVCTAASGSVRAQAPAAPATPVAALVMT